MNWALNNQEYTAQSVSLSWCVRRVGRVWIAAASPRNGGFPTIMESAFSFPEAAMRYAEMIDGAKDAA